MTLADPTIQQAAQALGRDPSQGFNRNMRIGKAAPAHDAQMPVRRGRFAGVLLIVSGILIALTGLGLALVWLFGTALSHGGHSADNSMREIVIGNDVLNVPANMIRFRSQRNSATLERLDLYFRWPQMEGFNTALEQEFNSGEINPAIVFVTATARQMTQDMSGRIEPLYAGFFVGEPKEAVAGLIRYGLSAESGYGGEVLVVEKESPYPYAARCVLQQANGLTPYCIRDIHLGRNLSVTYRYHASLLGQWMAMEAAIRAAFHDMLAE